MTTAARPLELVCPAGTPAALHAAVDAGADAVYCGFRDETNARNFPGLNFNARELQDGIRYAHGRGARVLVAINTFPRAGALDLWHRAVDDAAGFGADAVILCDIGLLDYAARRHPGLRLHLSVQAAASTPDAIGFYTRAFGVKRVVLPRVLTVEEIAKLTAEIACESEVFVFGGLCVMTEGRCSLSSYATGKSPNMHGVCSPPSHISYREEKGELVSRLGGYTINRIKAGAPAAYPTLCKGRFATSKLTGHIFEDPVSLNAAALLPALAKAGVTAIKIEGRQRGRAYIESVVRTFRGAVDALAAGKPVDTKQLLALAEGQAETQGAYKKTWR
jgi:O2-independent ubiquinone biosynthesis protein UbiU